MSRVALVTGASTGIGEQFARALAARGDDLVLVARSEQALHRLARELNARHGVRVEVVVCDLAVEHAACTVRQRTDALGLHIDLLMNNAGFATAGCFQAARPGHRPPAGDAQRGRRRRPRSPVPARHA